MPHNINDDDPDGNDISTEGIIRRLTRITAVLAKVTARLDLVNQGIVQPPPAASLQLVQGALSGARAQGLEVIRACDEIQTKLTPQ